MHYTEYLVFINKQTMLNSSTLNESEQCLHTQHILYGRFCYSYTTCFALLWFGFFFCLLLLMLANFDKVSE